MKNYYNKFKKIKIHCYSCGRTYKYYYILSSHRYTLKHINNENNGNFIPQNFN